MMGKQHIKTTIFFLASFILILFYHYGITTSNVIYYALFSFAVIISSTVPDIDLTDKQQGLKIWNKIMHLFYKIFTLPIKIIFRKNSENIISHRKIFHSFIGVMIYLAFIIIFLFLIYIGYNYISFVISTGKFVLNPLKYIKPFYSLIVSNYTYVYYFLLGSVLGFISHLVEDTATFDGINYLGFGKYKLKGVLITTYKNYYTDENGNQFRLRFWKKSGFGVIMLSAFSILFDIIFLYFKIYLIITNIYILFAIFFLFILFFEVLFLRVRIFKF